MRRVYSNNLELGWEKLILALLLIMGVTPGLLFVLLNWMITALILLMTIAIVLSPWWVWFHVRISHVGVKDDGIFIHFKSGHQRDAAWNEMTKLRTIGEEDTGVLLYPIAAFAMKEYSGSRNTILTLTDGSRFKLPLEIDEAVQNAHYDAMSRWITQNSQIDGMPL